MLQKLHKEFGLTIILTSHNLEDVMEMSDECVILDDGKVIEQGNPKEVARHLQKIQHPLEQSLPQILRLEEKFQIELTFSMEEAREQIRKKEYQLKRKTHFEGKTVLSISHLYAGYEKGKMFFRICQSKLKKAKSLQLSEQMEVENQRFFLVW